MKNGNYELVIAPPEYPAKKYRNRYCFKHQLVYWQYTGIIAAKDELIHHKDENRFNNTFSNLELRKRNKHSQEHSTKPKIKVSCFFCSKSIYRRPSYIKEKLKLGYQNFYCSRTCLYKSQIKINKV